MTVETGGGGIASLNATYPAGGDTKSEGDNHIRLTKAELQNEFPNFVDSDPVTATQAEINNACAHSAVSGFTLSNVVYIDDNGDSQGGSIFDISANIGAAWESVGPTGSGANNIWTALDALPAETKWVEVALTAYTEANTSSGYARQFTYARRTGSFYTTSSVTAINISYAVYQSALDTDYAYSTKKIPVSGSNMFDLYWLSSATSGGSAMSATISLVAFGV